MLWRWNKINLITKSISSWADKNQIKDATIRIFSIASLGTIFPFIKSDSAIWSLSLVWIFEFFLAIYRYKIGREFTFIAVVLILSPLFILVCISFLWYDAFYQECLKEKRRPVVPVEVLQQSDLEISQSRLSDPSR